MTTQRAHLPSIDEQRFRLLDHQVYQDHILAREGLKQKVLTDMASRWHDEHSVCALQGKRVPPVPTEANTSFMAAVMFKEYRSNGGVTKIGSIVLRSPAVSASGLLTTRNQWRSAVFHDLPKSDIRKIGEFTLYDAAVLQRLVHPVQNDVNHGLLPDISDDLLTITTAF